MPVATKQEAVDRLKQAVGEAGPDDLAEIYNELFPAEPITEDDARENQADVVSTVMGHIRNGLEVQEILDLWNVVFPRHRRVRFDEEQDLVYYDETIAPVS